MRRLLAFALALAATTLAAQTHPPKNHPKDHLKFTLILSRHGVRPPLTAAAALNARSSDPWPAWEVPLGHLTPHGADALAQLGVYLRSDFAQSGLFASASSDPATCPTPADVYLYSDTDERNISSTRATFTAFSGPTCPALPVYTWRAPASGPTTDPTFSPISGHTFAPPPAETSVAAMKAALGNANSALGLPGHPELALLASILSPAGSAHPAAKPILQEPISTSAGPTGDPMVSNRGPAPAGSTLAEDFLLEYADNRPLSEVGWGRLGATEAEVEANLRRLMPVHIAMFSYSHRTPLFARAESSNLLAHIFDTLQQAAVNQDLVPTPKPGVPSVPHHGTGGSTTDSKGVPTTPPSRTPTVPLDLKAGNAEVKINLHPSARIDGAFGPAGTKLVYISGHDTNLAGIAGLLGLHWTFDGVADDTPPDSELVFELWQKHHKDSLDWPFTLRIRFRAQSLTQLRHASPLTEQTPPIEIDLKPIGCRSRYGCELSEVLHAARAALDKQYTQLDIPPTQTAP